MNWTYALKKVECAVVAVPEMLDAVMKAVDKGSTELERVDAKVELNCTISSICEIL